MLIKCSNCGYLNDSSNSICYGCCSTLFRVIKIKSVKTVTLDKNDSKLDKTIKE